MSQKVNMTGLGYFH